MAAYGQRQSAYGDMSAMRRRDRAEPPVMRGDAVHSWAGVGGFQYHWLRNGRISLSGPMTPETQIDPSSPSGRGVLTESITLHPADQTLKDLASRVGVTAPSIAAPAPAPAPSSDGSTASPGFFPEGTHNLAFGTTPTTPSAPIQPLMAPADVDGEDNTWKYRLAAAIALAAIAALAAGGAAYAWKRRGA